MSDDPRARLDEIKARADDCQTYKFGMRNADRLAQEDAPAMAAALTAVLDMGPSIIETGGEEDPNFATGYNSGYEDALADIRTAITEALTQSERH